MRVNLLAVKLCAFVSLCSINNYRNLNKIIQLRTIAYDDDGISDLTPALTGRGAAAPSFEAVSDFLKWAHE